MYLGMKEFPLLNYDPEGSALANGVDDAARAGYSSLGRGGKGTP
jgi:hypothetical protein